MSRIRRVRREDTDELRIAKGEVVSSWVEIRCSECDQLGRFTEAHDLEGAAWTLRNKLKRAEWKIAEDGDFCPQCAELLSVTEADR